jgi:hypothetical protein
MEDGGWRWRWRWRWREGEEASRAAVILRAASGPPLRRLVARVGARSVRTPVHTQVEPPGVPIADEAKLPLTPPALQRLLAGDRAANVGEFLIVHQLVDVVARGMDGPRSVTVLPESPTQVARHADVQPAARTGKDVDVIATHVRKIETARMSAASRARSRRRSSADLGGSRADLVRISCGSRADLVRISCGSRADLVRGNLQDGRRKVLTLRAG